MSLFFFFFKIFVTESFHFLFASIHYLRDPAMCQFTVCLKLSVESIGGSVAIKLTVTFV